MDSDDEEEQHDFSYQGSSGSIILINCFDPKSHNTAAVAYEATCEIIRKYMRQSYTGLTGLCLYGTKDSGCSSLAIQNMVELLPLASPSLDDFKRIISTNISDYGQASDLKLADVLWYCSKMFKQCKKRLSERSVIMLTRLDIPPTNLDSSKRHQTLKRVIDLTHLGINLKVINVCNDDCLIDPFYKELLTASNVNYDYMVCEPVWNSEDIQQLLQQHTHRHLALARLPFEIGGDMSIGVAVYKLAQTCPKPKKTILSGNTCEILTKTNKVMKAVECDTETIGDSGSLPSTSIKEVPLLKSETLYCQNYGGELIEFTEAEIHKVKNPFPSRFLRLLGFKPHHTLCKEKWFYKQCAFLFPSESIAEGSTVAFKALHEACRQMKVLPICVLSTRSNSKPQLVALSPCAKPLGLNVDVGFDIIYIPFLENVKNVPVQDDDSPHKPIDEGHKIFMRDILLSLQFNYTSDTFENPVLQSLYRGIEALALDEEEIKPFLDTTKPDDSVFQNIDATLFEKLFGPFEVPATKRATSSKAFGPPSKKPQTYEEIDEELLEDRLTKGLVSKYTVNELKQILHCKKPAGLPSLNNLNKDKLVLLVYKVIGNKT